MSTWLEILAPEPAIEDAVYDVLNARGLGLPIFRRLEASNELPAQRIEITCLRGPETGHRGRYSEGQFSPDAWFAALKITLRTLRTPEARTFHWATVAAVRLAMTPAAALFTDSNLPTHAITEMLPQQPEPALDNAGNEDGTTLIWSMRVNARKRALPDIPPV